MNIYPINSVDNNYKVSFNGLFSKKKNDNVYVLPYGKTSIMNGEARTAIPEDSIIHFRGTYSIDLTTKDMKAKIKKLKRDKSIIIGREDINPNDTSISRKQFELKKIDGVLYIQNLSQFGTQFTLLNPNETVPVNDCPKPVNVRKPQGFTNFDPKYLRSKYSEKDPDFRGMIDQKYTELRIAKYSDVSTFGNDVPNGIINIQQAISTPPKNGGIMPQNGWHYRHFQYGLPEDVVERLSLNVKADPALIWELDELFRTGRYTDFKGKACRIPENKRVPGYYKTYDVARKWTVRHDPITMYFSRNLTPEMINAVSDISQKYARPSCNGMPLVGALPGKPWISNEKEPDEASVAQLAQRAERLDSRLKDVILSKAYRHWDYRNGYSDFALSAGEFTAMKVITDEYDAYLRLPR